MYVTLVKDRYTTTFWKKEHTLESVCAAGEVLIEESDCGMEDFVHVFVPNVRNVLIFSAKLQFFCLIS